MAAVKDVEEALNVLKEMEPEHKANPELFVGKVKRHALERSGLVRKTYTCK